MTVTISLVTGSPDEVRTRDQLLTLLDGYDLAKWRFTEQIQIEEGAVSHSHPILTINTRSLQDDAFLLAVYIHEQIHWYTLAHREEGGRAIAEFRLLYPDVPVQYPEGCGSERSNYLHFLVCYLEYTGLIELLGAAEARRVMEHALRRPFYRYIYRTVLRDFETIGDVVTRCGLTL